MDAHLVSLVVPGSFEAVQYLGLRLVVERMHKVGKGTVVAICSPAAGDGKSVTSINLAGALAQDPKARVLLIEVDLHRPFATMDDYLALGDPDALGLVDVILEPSLTLKEAVRHLPLFNLSILPGGSRSPAPYEVLKSPRFRDLLEDARRRYDYVILDAPPVVPVPDCRLIEGWVDGFIMVVSAHRTPRRMLGEALNLIRPEKILGLVFNRHDRMASRYYRYYYNYAYEQSKRWKGFGWRAWVLEPISKSPLQDSSCGKGLGFMSFLARLKALSAGFEASSAIDPQGPVRPTGGTGGEAGGKTAKNQASRGEVSSLPHSLFSLRDLMGDFSARTL